MLARPFRQQILKSASPRCREIGLGKKTLLHPVRKHRWLHTVYSTCGHGVTRVKWTTITTTEAASSWKNSLLFQWGMLVTSPLPYAVWATRTCPLLPIDSLERRRRDKAPAGFPSAHRCTLHLTGAHRRTAEDILHWRTRRNSSSRPPRWSPLGISSKSLRRIIRGSQRLFPMEKGTVTYIRRVDNHTCLKIFTVRTAWLSFSLSVLCGA